MGEVVEHRVSDHRTIGRRGGHDVDLETGRSIRCVAASRPGSRTDSLRDPDTLSEVNRPRLGPYYDRRGGVRLEGWPANEIAAQAGTQCRRACWEAIADENRGRGVGAGADGSCCEANSERRIGMAVRVGAGADKLGTKTGAMSLSDSPGPCPMPLSRIDSPEIEGVPRTKWAKTSCDPLAVNWSWYTPGVNVMSFVTSTAAGVPGSMGMVKSGLARLIAIASEPPEYPVVSL